MTFDTFIGIVLGRRNPVALNLKINNLLFLRIQEKTTTFQQIAFEDTVQKLGKLVLYF